MGYVALFLLTASTYFAAACLAVRLRPAGRVELLVMSTILWNAIVLVPIYVLGLLNRLYPSTLALASSAIAAGIIVASSRGVEIRSHLRTTLSRLLELAKLPLDAIRMAWATRSVVLIGILATGVLIGWTALTSYFAPAWPHWDCLWYHDTIIGFTLQNHGFKIVSLPNSLARVNCYPRACEMTQLWFVIFADRRIMEVTNSLLAPAFVGGAYLLCRRFNRDRIIAAGLACSLLLVPAATIQLQSTAVDLHTAMLLIVALYFTVREELRVGDAWLTGVALALGTGTKFIVAVPIAAIALVACIRFVRVHWRKRPKAVAATIASVFAMMSAMAATNYLRNYRHFGNPVFPHLVSSRWPGYLERGQQPGKFGVDLNLPFGELLAQIFSTPTSPIADGTPATSYGTGVPFVLAPLTLVALLCLAIRACGALVTPSDRSPSEAERIRNLQALGLLTIPAAVTLYTSPALFAARYQFMVIAVALALAAWFFSEIRTLRLAEGAVSAMILTSLLAAWWRTERFLVTPHEFIELVSAPFPQREVLLGRSPVTRTAGEARERELGAGDVVAFSDEYGGFPSLLWNSHFSNRLLYIPSSEDYVRRADAAEAKWILCGASDPNCASVRQAGSHWESIGPLHRSDGAEVFRRRTN